MVVKVYFSILDGKCIHEGIYMYMYMYMYNCVHVYVWC